MIEITINGVHSVVTDDLRKYIQRKIGRLDRFLSRPLRPDVRAEVFVKESKKSANKCTCEVILKLPEESLIAKESTMNMFAAVDIVEAKLRRNLAVYKAKRGLRGLHRRILVRLKRTES